MPINELFFQSPLGIKQADITGSAVGVARIDPEKAYRPVPLLLKEFIDCGSEKAWEEIRRRTDYTYSAIDTAFTALDVAEPFFVEILQLVESGKKLLFKPNMVSLPSIDPQTHSPVFMGTCVSWEFAAAVMRWFHDRVGISYYQMAIGEAGTQTSGEAARATKIFGRPVTAQALMEGKCGDHYGGWGFFFARKYLAECHPSDHTDDPMRGYEESLSGVCIPTGKSGDRLLVYDLNKIASDLSDGRDVPVPGGDNYRSITLHKALAGGDPDDAEDLKNWPGSVIVNVAKMKIHAVELFTAAIKNLGLGFYPMEADSGQRPGRSVWKYAAPDGFVPTVKTKVPHTRWVVRNDAETGAPERDEKGDYRFMRTGGLEASMADPIKAVLGQGVRMIHIIDAVECTNTNHFGLGCTPTSEGLVLASNDMVALDSCASRYLLNNVSISDAEKARREYHLSSDVIQEVPLPRIEGPNIVTGNGCDSSFSRYGGLEYCEKRGLGSRSYYVTGKDLWQGGLLVSLQRRLGRVDRDNFTELITRTLYYTPSKPLWDLQFASFAYLECNDRLTGSDFKQKFLDTFDENGDGVIDYMETGKRNFDFFMCLMTPWLIHDLDSGKLLKFNFLLATTQLKMIRSEWNPERHNIGEALFLSQSLVKSFEMAGSAKEFPDQFFPAMTWGKGKWPSFQNAMHRKILSSIYGPEFPEHIDLNLSAYGLAYQYAKSLPFKLYVPGGFGSVDRQPIPNVEETDDPDLIFTALFNRREAWKDFRLSEFRPKQPLLS